MLQNKGNRSVSRWMTALFLLFIICVSTANTCLGATAKVPVTMWFPTHAPEVVEWFKNFEAEFNKNNPDIQLTIEVQGITITHMRDKLVIAEAAGVAPDIHYESGNVIGRWVDNGLAAPLNEYIAKMPDQRDFLPDATDAVKYNGKVYAMPYAIWPIFDVYNMNLLEESGLALPHTWSELISTASKLTRKGSDNKINIQGYANALSAATVMQVFNHAMEQLGVPIIGDNMNKGSINNQAGRDALQYLRDLWQAGMGSPIDVGFLMGTAMQGKTAIFQSSGTDIQNLLTMVDSGINISLKRAVGPAVGKDSVQHNTPVIWMLKSTRYPQQAWRVMEAFLKPENLKKFYMIDGRYQPIRISQFGDNSIRARAFSKEQMDLLYSPVRTYGMKHPLYAGFRSDVGAPLLDAIKGTIAIGPAVEEADRLLNVSLKDYIFKM